MVNGPGFDSRSPNSDFYVPELTERNGLSASCEGKHGLIPNWLISTVTTEIRTNRGFRMTVFLLRTVALAALALLVTPLQSQPIPVEGTEMIPNEYGSEFPREIVWESDGSRMVLIPHGTFIRGTSGGTASEGPEQEIYLPSFYIGKYEISNEQYATFAKTSSVPPPRPSGHDALKNPSHPVTAIPWGAANMYALSLGKQLPTEAMWEKAARGPENTLYTTGNTPPQPGTINAGQPTTFAPTVPVDSETGDVSGYGVYHMGGNASEFAQDWFSRSHYQEAPKDNPQGPEGTGVKSIRGGSYLTPLERTRTTWRFETPSTIVRDEVGFRTAWVPKPVERVAEATPTPRPVDAKPKVDPVDSLLRAVLPYLEKGHSELPKGMMASQALLGGARDGVQFVNFTPFRMSITFLGPKDEAVYHFAEPLGEASFRNLQLPAQKDLFMIAYAPDAPNPGPVKLGPIRAESRAVVLLKTEMFAPVVQQDGKRLEVLKENTEAEQIYQAFSPMWNHMEIYNSLSVPLMVKLTPVIRGVEEGTPDEYSIEPKESLRLMLDPGNYSLAADYFGAREESSEPVTIRIDDKAARRQVIIEEDGAREGGVVVITQRRPYLKLDLRNVNQIARPVTDATAAKKKR